MQNDLTAGRVPTPLAALIMVTDAQGALWASDFEGFEDRLHRLLSRRIGRRELREGAVPQAVAGAVAAYFKGDLAAIDRIDVRLHGTAFQNLAWAALRRIPPGAPASYGEQARRIGRPGAARAVGHANGSNPFGLILPCHRLLGADGALTGYAGGLERKAWLLDHEARHAAGRAAL